MREAVRRSGHERLEREVVGYLVAQGAAGAGVGDVVDHLGCGAQHRVKGIVEQGGFRGIGLDDQLDLERLPVEVSRHILHQRQVAVLHAVLHHRARDSEQQVGVGEVDRRDVLERGTPDRL